MQTRPGNEPEREPEDSAGGGEDAGAARERDPFTPKVRPGDEGGPEGGEPERGGEDLAETVDMGGLVPEESAGEEPDLAETVNLQSLMPEDSADEGAAGSGESGEPSDAGEDESEDTPGEAEDEGLHAAHRHAGGEGVEPESAAEPEEPAGHHRHVAEPEPAEEEPAPRRRSGEAEGEEEPAPRRGFGAQPAEPEGEEEPTLGRRSGEPEGEEEPAQRRRSAEPDGEQEPAPRRRSAPGQPPRPLRRPEGQEPRRVPGRPHANHASSEPGPKRRPPSEHAPDQAAKRRPAPEPRPAAGAASAAPAAKPAPTSLGRRRLIAAFWPPRLSRNQAVVGVLLAALGAALAIQVRATNSSDQILRGARNDDLVNILDEVTSRGQSLDAELRNLETQNAAIQDSADKAQAALAQAQQKAKDLQILAGTVKAKGSGITMTISDPQGQLKSATLLNAMEELRAAGAEVIQVDDVRVVVSSSFVDAADGGIALDGHELAQPYVYKVIGDPTTLGPAMQIPGGVVATVKSSPGASATITSGQVLVDAVAPQPGPDYAKAG